jgi:uncharacterized protein YciU (UPF0263 family)
MAHKYKRRTLDEAIELAQETFREKVAEILTPNEIDELRSLGTTASGPLSDRSADEWKNILGYLPDKRMYYEVELYKPSDSHPYIEKSYARILITRDRSSQQCEILWKPDVSV